MLFVKKWTFSHRNLVGLHVSNSEGKPFVVWYKNYFKNCESTCVPIYACDKKHMQSSLRVSACVGMIPRAWRKALILTWKAFSTLHWSLPHEAYSTLQGHRVGCMLFYSDRKQLMLFTNIKSFAGTNTHGVSNSLWFVRKRIATNSLCYNQCSESNIPTAHRWFWSSRRRNEKIGWTQVSWLNYEMM